MAENQLVTFCTVPDQKTGEKIAEALVQERLAACVNVVPGHISFYRWQGKVEKAAECLLIIKTTATRFDSLKDRIKAMHSYDLPEIIAVPICRGDDMYLAWLTESVK